MRKDKRFADHRIIESSGNVFADLGLPNSEEELLRAKMIWRISDTIEAQELRQAESGSQRLSRRTRRKGKNNARSR
jgi:hypothetical protein